MNAAFPRSGRRQSVNRGGWISSYAYNDAGLMTLEDHSGTHPLAVATGQSVGVLVSYGCVSPQHARLAHR